MEQHSVSQSISVPTVVPIDIQPSADTLMTDWLAERVQRALEILIDEAPLHNVHIKQIYVFGFEYYDEPTRVIFIQPEIEASDRDRYNFWGRIAEAFATINQPRPKGVPNADVTVEVFMS